MGPDVVFGPGMGVHVPSQPEQGMQHADVVEEGKVLWPGADVEGHRRCRRDAVQHHRPQGLKRTTAYT